VPNTQELHIRPLFLAALFDLAAILIFTAIGRRSHAETLDLLGYAGTVWPFLTGTAIGWLLARNWRSPMRIWPQGVIIWLSTVIFGMLLRTLSGQGVQFSFVVVASIATGVLLIGWRLVAHFVARARATHRG
jgi:hypothetical protein